ncbi:type II toxin-antitoxin system prevent-host-death family antitoxin [Nonomuraea sp. NPDC005650]|uniref:type II toxin-antitoxin system prevent-host-death family antitoxin n=1 Tax=Nonomuraea sp. NPDC005650 TaxID=3157045 RepID=UPI0033BA05BD
MSAQEPGTGHQALDVGLRDARASLGQLVDKVCYENVPVFLTKHGRRVAAIRKVDPLLTPDDVLDEDSDEPISIPGNVEAAAGFLLGSLSGKIDQERLKQVSQYSGISQADFLGGLATIAWYMFPAPSKDEDEGEEREHLDQIYARVTLMISRVLPSWGADSAVVPIFSGSMVAAHLGQHPAVWRNRLPVKVDEVERTAWMLGCYLLADALRELFGQDFIEEAVYSAVETVAEVASPDG